jgi:hypothetical protein
MRESRTSGSGRGDQGNLVPYRHRILAVRRCPGEGPLTTPERTLSLLIAKRNEPRRRLPSGLALIRTL